MFNVVLLHLPTGSEHNIVQNCQEGLTVDTIINVVNDFIVKYVCMEYNDDLDDIQLRYIQNHCMTTYNISKEIYDNIIYGIIDYIRNNVIKSYHSDIHNLPPNIWTKVDIT